MRLKDNLSIYVLVGVIIFFVTTLNKALLIQLILDIVISIGIGKTVEFISYQISKKYLSTLFQSMAFSMIVLAIILGIMTYIGVVEELLIVFIISVAVTIFMVILSHKKYEKYNKKLEEYKNQLKKEVENENY